MQSDGHRLEHGRFIKCKSVGQSIKDTRRNGDILRKSSGAAVFGAGYPQDLTVVTKIDIAAAAILASAAEDGRVESNPIAHGEARHAVTKRGNSSGGFVAHDNRRNAPSGRAIVAVDVAATDAAGRHADKHFTAGRSWIRQIGNFQMLVF